MVIEKTARETLTAVEMDIGDELRFTLADGQTRSIVLQAAGAKVFHTTVKEPKVELPGAHTHYRFHARFTIDDTLATIVREVGTQESFYQPRELMGLRIWLDACDDIFNFLTETHGPCRPRRKVRLAIQDQRLRICPVLLHAWCPLPAGGLRIEDCYNADDCWMGAYFGASAHGGLDINHRAGTPIWSPIPIDNHELFNSVAAGDNNNRWRGWHRWADGSTWTIGAYHVIRVLPPLGQPFPAGTQIADGAGVWVGDHEHSHFTFKVREPGAGQDDDILLDPWILFQQMYEDRELTTANSPSPSGRGSG